MSALDDSASFERIAQELDSLGRPTDVEVESLEAGDRDLVDDVESIAEPFDPDRIDVITRTPTVDLLLSRLRHQQLDLAPDFQRRRGIWDRRAKSRLIESLLLRIPLPTLYAAESDGDAWVVVDGIQRLSAIAEFVEPEAVDAPALQLTGLEYLHAYEGQRFTDLPARLQTRLRESELVVHLIRRGTPEPVKFNIFARINTGGQPLSAQELRHALIPGPARALLREWAESDAFREATGRSVGTERMADREMVLRFVTFYELGVEGYRSGDFDDYLRHGMKALNGVAGTAHAVELQHLFGLSLKAAHLIFEGRAFRKVPPAVGSGRRGPINKALFETVTVALARVPVERLVDFAIGGRREDCARIEGGLQALMDDPEFIASISQGTGQIAKVRYRFAMIEKLFAETSA